ncbi:hypothetical protein UlMin_027743 [Ulmus minor]
MQQPPGFETKGADHMVDNSLFLRFNGSSTIFLLVYVDDIIVAGSNEEELTCFIKVLNKLFSLKDHGDLNYFLGIEVKSATDSHLLSQKKYIANLLKKSKMDKAKPLPTPMVSNLKLTTTDGDPITNGTEYRSIKAVKRILRYLKGTMDEGILIRRSKTLALTGYCDANWGNDLDNRRSNTCYCIYLGNSLVSWSSKKQTVVSRSSTKAEYRSLANATSEICGFNPFFVN